MTVAELVKSFTERESRTRLGNNSVISEAFGRSTTVGKHEAHNFVHLKRVLAEADEACPRAADTIRWLLWHEIVDAQWYMHMAEMLERETQNTDAD